jgi:hypothetical protein
MRLAVGAGFLVVALAVGAACGGSSNSADKKYVDALVVNAMSDKATSKGLTTAGARCLASAIVDAYHASAFEKAKLTPAKLRNPNTDLTALPNPTADQASEIGGAFQRCKLGGAFAQTLAKDFHADAAATKCIGTNLDHGSGIRRFLGVAFINESKVTTAEARPFVDVLAKCTDLGTLALEQAGLNLTAQETGCLNKHLEASDRFLDLIAGSMGGHEPSDAEDRDAVQPALLACLTPARLQQISGATGPG